LIFEIVANAHEHSGLVSMS